MSHPFWVGEVYRNRRGQYEVVSIEEPVMTVRYTNGRVFKGDIEAQARIWENLQAECAGVKPGANGVAPSQTTRLGDGLTTDTTMRPRNKGRQGALFEGLVEHDFQAGVTGTGWRARESLGGLLAQCLSDVLGTPFQSWAIYRRAHVYIARAGCYMETQKEGVRNAKFRMALQSEGARYGFYIERNSEAMDEGWDWLHFVAGLRNEDSKLQLVSAAMRQHGVTAQPYLVGSDNKSTLPGRLVAGPDGLTWCPAGGGAVATAWPDFAEMLSSLDPTRWCDLYFQAEMSKAEAIELGVDIADRVVKTFVGLLPLYTLSLRQNTALGR